MRRDWLPPALLSAFLLLWMWAAWAPVDRFDWWLENILIFICVPAVVLAFPWFRFSDLSYVLITAFVCLHVLGSHWSYSRVPWGDWSALGFERNMYDRAVHFGYGFLLALPTREVLARLTGRNGPSSAYFTVEFIVATSALYEIAEWLVVIIVAPDLGDAFLGAQGDHFDAIADMALAALGAILVMLAWLAVTAVRRRRSPAAARAPAPATGIESPQAAGR